jgi:hypothetical protein
MSEKNDTITPAYPADVWDMSLQEVTAHIEIADEKARTAASELKAAEEALAAAKSKHNHASKYARLTRDFTKKALSAPNDEKETKVRQSYRAKFGALAATQLVAKAKEVKAEVKKLPAPAPVETAKEQSRLSVEEGMSKIEQLVDAAKDAVAAVSKTENQNTSSEPKPQGA